MPRARFERLEPEKQARILEAATEEFAARGFEGASYNQIIEKAGVSKGAMYYYFDDKMDLFCTVVKRASSHMTELWGAALDSEALESDFWGTFEDIARKQAAFAFEHPEMMALGKSLMELDPALVRQGPLGEVYALTRTWIGRIMARGQAAGAVRDDIPLELLVALLQGVGEAFDRWFVAHFEETMSGDPEALVQMTVDVFRRIASPAGQEVRR